jgi:hypothetical protein
MKKSRTRPARPASKPAGRRAFDWKLWIIPTVVVLQVAAAAALLPGTLGRVSGIAARVQVGSAEPAGEQVHISEITQGRHRLTASSSFTGAQLEFRWNAGALPADHVVYLCIRNPLSTPLHLEISPAPSRDSGTVRGTLQAGQGSPAPYQYVRLNCRPDDSGFSVQLQPEMKAPGAQTGFVLDEISLLDSSTIKSLQSPDWHSLLALSRIGRRGVFCLTALSVLAFYVGRSRRRDLWLAASALAVSLIAISVSFRLVYRPDAGYDYPLAFETQYKPIGNLTEGLALGSQALQGHGITLPGGVIDTYRMPGYALFVAASNWFASDKENLSELGIGTVRGHIVFQALAIAFFAWSASELFPAWVVSVLVFFVAWRPSHLDYTQGDAVMLACGLLVTASLCLILGRERRGEAPGLVLYVLLHAACALFFAMRTDIIPGWIALSVLLHWHNKKYLAMPLLFCLAIGISWGLYKQAHGSAFSMTTDNFGHVAFVGLWQVPQHRFVWEPTDSSYDRWISAHGYKYADPATSKFATPEAVRFWLTYPGFTISMIWHKMSDILDNWLWSGTIGGIPLSVPSNGAVLVWGLFIVIVAGLVVGYERRRTFALAWPVFLNLPLFMLLQASGPRFIYYPTTSIVIAGLPLLFEHGFRDAVQRHWRGASAVVVLGVAFWMWQGSIDQFLLAWDSFRYWTPILNPMNSTLNVMR